MRDTLFADPVPLPAHATPHESVNGKLTAQTLLATYYLKRLGLTMETGVSPLTHPFVMDPVPLPSLPLQR